jgi:hypothetical protein
MLAAAFDLRPVDLGALAGSSPPQSADGPDAQEYEEVVDLGLLAWELTPLTRPQIGKVLRRVRQRRDICARQAGLGTD